MKWPSLSLLTDFSLKSILLDIRTATPTSFLGPFDWNIFSQPFTLRRCLSLWLRCVSCMQQKNGFCFCIQSVSLCLIIGKLSPFILMGINEQWLLAPVILVFVDGYIIFCVFPFFGICCCEIINCLCFCWYSQLPWVVVFLLVFCVGLGLWLGIG